MVLLRCHDHSKDCTFTVLMFLYALAMHFYKDLSRAMHFNLSTLAATVLLLIKCLHVFLINRGGVKNTRLEAKAKDTKKNPRPKQRTALPRTDPLGAKNRNARGQDQEHSASVLTKVFQKKFC